MGDHKAAKYILDNCKFLCKEHCLIFDGVLYEWLKTSPHSDFKHKYRYFFSDDDYDYVTDHTLEANLDVLFKK